MYAIKKHKKVMLLVRGYAGLLTFIVINSSDIAGRDIHNAISLSCYYSGACLQPLS